MNIRFLTVLSALCFMLSCGTLSAQESMGNIFQARELTYPAEITEDAPEATVPDTTDIPAAHSAPTTDFINFGYLQNNSVLPYLHYEALTHIAAPFVDFLEDGQLLNPNTFRNRNAHLKAGGSAQRAGTKVVLCVRNYDFSEPILHDVMTNAASRNTLVNAVRDLVINDDYCAGVNFDFEMRWNTTTRNGITLFLQQMRNALPDHEISIYVQPTFNSSYWDFPAIIDGVDYVLYSTYDFGTAQAHANADYDNVIIQATRYLNAGVPPEKLVLTWASYGRRWWPAADYGDGGGGSKQSQGFYDTLFNTTLRQAHGGPFTANYVRGDEIVWYNYMQNGTPTVGVGETTESLEVKISAALSFPSANEAWRGKRLRGVGWWSLMWVSKYFTDYSYTSTGGHFRSYDPVSQSVVTRAPYYRHIDLLNQEILKQPGQTRFVLESFENENAHWRNPLESPDTTGDTDFNSRFAAVAAPSGPGRPENTVRAGRLRFDFEASSGNRAFLRHEMVNSSTETHITDIHAALALVSSNTRFHGHYYVAGNYSNRNLRLALVDGLQQIEVSNPIPLPSAAGWHTFTWNINDPTQVHPWTTSEPALNNGNGIVDTAGPDARDISFLGFIVEGGGSGVGNIYFDELTYEERAPGGKQYVINEFRYRDDASEFVEIWGEPGAFPADMSLVIYDASDGSEHSVISLAGHSIPPSGLFVVGDPGVPGASGTTGFTPPGWSTATNDIPNGAPGALQLYGTQSGYVYDSVVHSAHGGLGDLTRIQTRRVTREGYGWMGNVGPGVATVNEPYTMGRLPDGSDTNINQADFSFMPPTPGQPNGATGIMNTVFDFTTPPPGAFQTYQQMRFVNPATAGLPASPGGGNAYRCVDTSGGGVIGVFGDAQTGDDRGVEFTGQLYIPPITDPAQAIAVGFCATQGSAFFADNAGSTGYEDGYWLIFENNIVDLANGQPNAPSHFQFLMATNDNQHVTQSVALGSNMPLGATGVARNSWTSFRLKIDPIADPAEQLLAQINGVDIYKGPIPEDGPGSGAAVVGHRERGGITSRAGTWVDDLLIQYSNPPTRVEDYHLY